MKKIIAIIGGVLTVGLAIGLLVSKFQKRIKISGHKRKKAKPEHDFLVE